MDQVLFVAGEQLHMATLSVESQHIANINILREKKAAPFFFLVDFGQCLSKLVVTV